jgi:hypothetical protein
VAVHKGPRSESPGQPPAYDGYPPTHRVEERPVDCDTRIPRSRRPIAVADDQTGDVSSYSVSLVTPEESLSYSEKTVALAASLATQFQPVTGP